MKKIMSVVLAAAVVMTAFCCGMSVTAAEVFKEGDEIYLAVDKSVTDGGTSWADGILYANFSSYSRADNGDKSIVISEADPELVNPRTGVVYDEELAFYRYTVMSSDAGKSVMRFWRGNEEKLWNCSVPLSADEYAAGKNLVVVTGWTDIGYTRAVDEDPVDFEDGPFRAIETYQLYAHAASNDADETDAWVKWHQNSYDSYTFFLPSSVKSGDEIEIYSSLMTDATLGSQDLPAGGTAKIKAEKGKTCTLSAYGREMTVNFLFSSAEAALWVNNTDSFSGFSNFFSYLQSSKENYVSATGAIANADGNVEDVEIKKIKGRGNTSWNADKKGFNVNFKNAVEVAGMEKCKKFSLISNFQDATMARNRILYDMADEVEVPYASDSRMIDFYVNGEYQGTYQMCEKIAAGKNTLISDVDEEGYINSETGERNEDFSFVVEIDPSPNADDITVSTSSGISLTIKTPEPESGDSNLDYVRGYVRKKFNAMFDAVKSSSSTLDDYIDINSLAKVYLINELGKNWDSGAGSFFFVYKPDENGNYKFFASPVWDYDNSLGNANGIDSDLNRMGVSDYTLPSGWFSTKKGGYGGPNFLATAVKNSQLMDEVYTVWFEDFLPAIEKLNEKGVSSGELYSADVYESIIADSAEMNYQIWEMIVDTSWIANHSRLRQYRAAYEYNAFGQVTGVTLSQDASYTTYDQYSFDGEFQYMIDWTNSRAAWISSRYIAYYTPTEPVIEPTQPETEPPTEKETEAVKEEIPDLDLKNAVAAWVFDSDNKTSGDKLTEYGSSSGYAATTGSGLMTLSVDGENLRALEWSDAEYGKSGAAIVPIMAAGSKNLWGEPYINLSVDASGYETLKFTAYFAGSNKAPATWKLQYSTDSENFTDIEDAVFTISAENRKELTAYFDMTELPKDAAKENLSLRLVPVSMTTVSGGNTSEKPSGGEIALNYIVIDGYQKTSDGEYPKGDVNLSGIVDITDATLIQRYLAALCDLSDEQLKLADTDESGKVEIVDATRIQRYLADLLKEL